MELTAIWILAMIGGLGSMALALFLIRCWCGGRAFLSKERMDGKVVVVTGADSKVGIELVRELCKRGAERVIVGMTNVELGQDVAVDARGEFNGDVVVEFCDMASLRSIRDFCTKVLETESRVHVLINHACVMWHPFKRTAEGHEYHWGVNHLAHFVMTQLLMPLLLRGTPDARVVTLSSKWHKSGAIRWSDPDYSSCSSSSPHCGGSVSSGAKASTSSDAAAAVRTAQDGQRRDYDAHQAFCQSKLANVLFTRELARRLNGTGVNSYSVDPGNISTGVGWHMLPGLGFPKSSAAVCCWLPCMKPTEYSINTTLYCAIEPSLSEQSGLYYSECAPALTSEEGANLDDAYRLWEMSERAVRLTS